MSREPLDPPAFVPRKDYVTPEELADLLSLTDAHVRRAAWSGELPAIIVDHHILSIRRADVLRWLERRHAERPGVDAPGG
jgi:excisionase family DNA binding protein